ncbi:MAG: PIN domain-containing protein [Vulcanimicrobiaceae bacterium]
MIAGLISAGGAPRELLLRWLAGEFELLVSPALLDEFERVLLRPKFRGYVAEAEVRSFIAIVRRLASVVADPFVRSGLTPDPHDDYLVALAQTTRAWPYGAATTRPLAEGVCGASRPDLSDPASTRSRRFTGFAAAGRVRRSPLRVCRLNLAIARAQRRVVEL